MSDFKPWLERALRGEALGKEGARQAMDALVDGEVGEAQAAAFLGALQARGPGVPELVGFAEALRGRALELRPARQPLIDTCGTGGDGLHTFNFSTAAALVAAGAGAAVAKHGNRAVSSRSGSADVLEALGVAIDVPEDQACRSLDEAGFAFLFAPRYHPAMARVAALRRALGVRTAFNLLGPLSNPARVKRQVVGIYDAALLETYALVLSGLGAERAMVVWAEDGMDELSPAAVTRICHVDKERGIWSEYVRPQDAGFKPVDGAALRGGDARENARTLEAILEGARGPLTDGTLLNAAAALVVAGRAGSIKEGAELARESVESGRARGVLEALRRLKDEAHGAE